MQPQTPYSFGSWDLVRAFPNRIQLRRTGRKFLLFVAVLGVIGVVVNTIVQWPFMFLVLHLW